MNEGRGWWKDKTLPGPRKVVQQLVGLSKEQVEWMRPPGAPYPVFPARGGGPFLGLSTVESCTRELGWNFKFGLPGRDGSKR